MPESPDIDVRKVRIGALAILGAILFAVGVAWLTLHALGPAANSASHTIESPRGTVAPRLQAAPQVERTAYAREKEQLLSRYGWVDRKAGIARIPLDEAMRLMAASNAADAADAADASHVDHAGSAPGTVRAAGRHAGAGATGPENTR